MNNSVTVILPGVVVAASALLVFLVDMFSDRKAILGWIASAGLVSAAAVAVGQWLTLGEGIRFNAREPELGFTAMVALDKYALFCVLLFSAVGVLTIMLADAYMSRRRDARGEFYGLLLLIITGMIGMGVSNDIIAFFVSFELMSLPTYVLAGFIRARQALRRGGHQVLRQRRLRLRDPALRPGAALRRDRLDELRQHRGEPQQPGAGRRERRPHAGARPHRRRVRVQDLGRAVPQLGAGRLRRRSRHR